ncbi:MAG: hypothetical protein A2840_02360 [Candidatus Buchananbacteria bacterium RIFCSPHIGHO2_01_FULL_47_11b]|uniref:Carbohydrate-binding module family 96 domain-containing protein n=1 Tax=Candidatus Buchananbacteria bacterium RIFCSPHIGHO2_01_FULL_47_11b TaxID=1797537 RepID=A0A1G1Y648_9BACT|nr:MAG: hypothetical protein A2840_02360 [Candidatus Buchananbacteria bacterium RIFCSPHIGHO2_01_FULL_47_11b]
MSRIVSMVVVVCCFWLGVSCYADRAMLVYPLQDIEITELNPNPNEMSTQQYASVGFYPYFGNNRCRFLMKFDIETIKRRIPCQARNVQAALFIDLVSWGHDNDNPRTVNCYPIVEPFMADHNIYWDRQPAVNETQFSSVVISHPKDNWFTLDVTKLIFQEHVSGLELRMASETAMKWISVNTTDNRGVNSEPALRVWWEGVESPCNLPEDVDGNGVVDQIDWEIADHGRQAHGEPGYDPRLDLNGDGRVDYIDTNRISHAIGQQCSISPTPTPPISVTPTPNQCDGDFNHDGRVDHLDLFIFLEHWHR